MAAVDAQQRLLSKVRIEGACWVWTGANKGNGYGHTSRGPAHRRSYEVFVGPVPKGMDVCHACDNRPCINPAHLFVGTRLENMQDCKRKGRIACGAKLSRRGEESSSAKLKWTDVREIRASSETSKHLAARFGVSSDNINRIRRNETWKAI